MVTLQFHSYLSRQEHLSCTFAVDSKLLLQKMKTPLIVTNTSRIPAWRQPAGKAERILAQVKKLTSELHDLQTELYRELAEEDGRRRSHSALIAAPARDGLIELKAAADQLRRVLWFYVQNSSHACDSSQLAPEPDTRETLTLQEPFMQQGIPCPTGGASSSFFERLNLVIDGYMHQRGISTGKTPKP